MACRNIEKVEKYHLGELGSIESEIIEKHLDNCQNCSSYLQQLKAYDNIISNAKSYAPKLENQVRFKNSIIEKVSQKRRHNDFGIMRILDSVIYILVQPATKFAFVAASVIIFGVFIYQQTILVQKIGSLEERMEAKIRTEDAAPTSKKAIETFFRKKSGVSVGDEEYNRLLDDYRLLLLKHKLLIKALQEKYPNTYEDILKQLEEADLLPENTNI